MLSDLDDYGVLNKNFNGQIHSELVNYLPSYNRKCLLLQITLLQITVSHWQYNILYRGKCIKLYNKGLFS